MVYQWKSGARRSGSAQIVGERLEALRVEHHDALTPRMVVEDARDGQSPLHPYFQWDDATAAEQWRLEQAGALIREVVIVFGDEIPDAPTEPMRAFVSLHDRDTGAPAYTSTLNAMQHAGMRSLVLRNAKQELEGWRRRYRSYVELANAVAKVEDVIHTIESAA